MKTQIIILCAVAALAAGCNRSPQGATGADSSRIEGISTNDTGTLTNRNTNRFGTSQDSSGTPDSGTKSPDSGNQP